MKKLKLEYNCGEEKPLVSVTFQGVFRIINKHTITTKNITDDTTKRI